MRKKRNLFAVVAALVCLCLTVTPISAATVSKSASAADFGTLTGILYESYASVESSVEGNSILSYGFSYETKVTVAPATWATIHATVAVYNTSTGVFLEDDACVASCEGGNLTAGYYCELDGISGIRGTSGITVTAFGCHEARYYDSYVVYTKNTYNLYTDHGLV